MSIIETLKNAVPMLVLHSPIHAVMSKTYVVLRFTGRKTGRAYRMPVAYVQHGQHLWLSTDSKWWLNLADGAPVRVRLKGKELRGTPRVIHDTSESVKILDALVTRIPSYAALAHIPRPSGKVTTEDLEGVVASKARRAIEITLEEGAP